MKTAITSLAQVEAMRGTRIQSDWLTVTQDEIEQFADVTRDRQWIHVDRVYAPPPNLRTERRLPTVFLR